MMKISSYSYQHQISKYRSSFRKETQLIAAMQVVEILPRNYYLPFSNKGKVMVGQVAYIFTFVFILFNTGISAQDTPRSSTFFNTITIKQLSFLWPGNSINGRQMPTRSAKTAMAPGRFSSICNRVSISTNLWLMAAGYLIQATPGKSTTVRQF
jgi:hypothetical protein